jgi:ribosomal-protein-alanine N-acetyltransferase
VRPSNIAAIALYTSAGFDRLGARKGYYKARDGREDALVFVREFQDIQD